MKILSMLFIVMSIEKLLGTVLIAYNKQNAYTMSVIVASIINISLNAFFICVLNLGAIGVAIASVIAEAIAMLVQLWYLPNNFQKKMVFFPCKNYFIAGIVMLLALLGLNSLVMGNFGHLILNIVCGCLIYCAILILLKDTMVINTITKIKSKKYHG